MKKLIWLGVASIALFSVTATARAAEDIGFENIFENNVSVDLKVNGQDGPVKVDKGERIVVSWLSEGATRCRGNWSRNDIKTSGTVAGKISKSVIVKVACINRDGDRDDDSVVVNVSGGAVIAPPTTSDKTQIEDRFKQRGNVLLEIFSKEIADFRKTITTEYTLVSYEKETDTLITYIKTELNKSHEELLKTIQQTITDIELNRIDRNLSDRIDSIGAEARGRWNLIKQKFSSTTSAQPTTTAYYPGFYIGFEQSAYKPTSYKSTDTALIYFSRVDGSTENYTIKIYGGNGDNKQLIRSIFYVSQNTALSLPFSEYAVFKPGANSIYVCAADVKESDCTGVEFTTRRNAATFTITAPQPTIVLPTISVNLKANGSDGPITVAAGTSVTLAYSTTGKIAECKGDVSGYETGSTSVTANATKTFSVSCSQDGGTGSASDSVTVNVAQPTTTATTPTPTTSGTPSITVTGPVNSYGAPGSTAVSFTSSGVSTVKVEACVNKTDCTVISSASAVAGSATSVRWDFNGTEPYVGAFGTKPIYLKVTDTVSGVYDFADSYIYVTPPTSGNAGSSFAGAGVPSDSVWEFLKTFFGR